MLSAKSLIESDRLFSQCCGLSGLRHNGMGLSGFIDNNISFINKNLPEEIIKAGEVLKNKTELPEDTFRIVEKTLKNGEKILTVE